MNLSKSDCDRGPGSPNTTGKSGIGRSMLHRDLHPGDLEFFLAFHFDQVVSVAEGFGGHVVSLALRLLLRPCGLADVRCFDDTRPRTGRIVEQHFQRLIPVCRDELDAGVLPVRRKRTDVNAEEPVPAAAGKRTVGARPESIPSSRWTATEARAVGRSRELTVRERRARPGAPGASRPGPSPAALAAREPSSRPPPDARAPRGSRARSAENRARDHRGRNARTLSSISLT